MPAPDCSLNGQGGYWPGKSTTTRRSARPEGLCSTSRMRQVSDCWLLSSVCVNDQFYRPQPVRRSCSSSKRVGSGRCAWVLGGNVNGDSAPSERVRQRTVSIISAFGDFIEPDLFTARFAEMVSRLVNNTTGPPRLLDTVACIDGKILLFIVTGSQS